MRVFQAIRQLRKSGVKLRDLVEAARNLKAEGEEITADALAFEFCANFASDEFLANPQFDWDKFLEFIMAILPIILKLLGL